MTQYNQPDNRNSYYFNQLNKIKNKAIWKAFSRALDRDKIFNKKERKEMKKFWKVNDIFLFLAVR